mmetsp:Transcript_107629/g.299822  ORF Transcript_107629/g.299822 Transcript_107629/m.299822 type:complete len:204 (-) Transcript_107629:64-675(-)
MTCLRSAPWKRMPAPRCFAISSPTRASWGRRSRTASPGEATASQSSPATCRSRRSRQSAFRASCSSSAPSWCRASASRRAAVQKPWPGTLQAKWPLSRGRRPWATSSPRFGTSALRSPIHTWSTPGRSSRMCWPAGRRRRPPCIPAQRRQRRTSRRSAGACPTARACSCACPAAAARRTMATTTATKVHRIPPGASESYRSRP